MRLVEATTDDLPLMMAWRSNPLIYAGFYSQKAPLTWDEHINWFQSRNKDWRTFIIIYEGRKVGVVNLGQLDHWSSELGIFVGEVSLWGKGIGKQAVQLGLNYLKGIGKEYCHTTILDNNKRSIRMFENLGFEFMAKAREGESYWVKTLSC